MLLQIEGFSKPSLKLRRESLKGFTLIEILVAVAIITMIVSMVYGSYFATAKSADVYKTRIMLCGQTRKVISRMARQIRCSYIGELAEDEDSTGKDFREKNIVRESPDICFDYEAYDAGSWILHLVTTNRLFCENEYAEGLFDIAYKFNKENGTFYISQRRFTGTSENNIEDRNWRPVLTNVKSAELDFFDGWQWSGKWDFKLKRKLPIAVKIVITCEDENSRQCHYGTVAYVNCSKKTELEYSLFKNS
jgi:prepilin-type N-terminal cleavage/methylation domain-containing protein